MAKAPTVWKLQQSRSAHSAVGTAGNPGDKPSARLPAMSPHPDVGCTSDFEVTAYGRPPSEIQCLSDRPSRRRSAGPAGDSAAGIFPSDSERFILAVARGVPIVWMLTAQANAADGAHAARDAADPGDTCQSPDDAEGVLQTGLLGFCDLAHFFGLSGQLGMLPTSATRAPSW